MKTYAMHYSARTVLEDGRTQQCYGTAVIVRLEDSPSAPETAAAFVEAKFPEPLWYGRVWSTTLLGVATDTVLSINAYTETLGVEGRKETP